MRASPFHRLGLATVLATVVLAAAFGGWMLRQGTSRASARAPLATVYPVARPLPDFALVAHDGARFDRAALLGHYTWLFLGFTRCPDVCPATLTTLAAARRALALGAGVPRPAVVMVSVDPEHDTPAVLAAFVPRFDATFIGVRGESAALAPIAAALGAYYAPGRADGAGTVSHSGAVFLIDPAARIQAVWTSLPAPALLATDYARLARPRDGAG